MKKFGRVFGLVFMMVTVLGAFVPRVQADEVYTFVVKKQEEKAKNRWSLEEWLQTRDKMRLMDLWLALHSPSPYEFFMGGDYQMMKSPNSGETGTELFVAGYASIVGLGLQKTWAPGDIRTLGTFFLRIFGFHAQGMNITLQAGLRQSDLTDGAFRNAFGGVSMTVYMLKFFGLEGLYRYNFKSVPSESGAEIGGSRYEGGAFIDFRFLRIFGNYFSEEEELSMGGVTGPHGRTGTSFGLKLFF